MHLTSFDGSDSIGNPCNKQINAATGFGTSTSPAALVGSVATCGSRPQRLTSSACNKGIDDLRLKEIGWVRQLQVLLRSFGWFRAAAARKCFFDFEFVDCPQTTSCGILRGSARPGIGATINFYSFYLVGAPLAIVLAFVWKLGFVGLCYGLLGAQIACVVSILTVVFKTDWERETFKAANLVGKSNDDQTVKCDEEALIGFVKEAAFEK